MATNYPTGIDTNPGDPTPSETLKAGGHANLHTFVQDAMIAVQTYLGVTASAVTTTITYLLTNTASIDPGHKHTVASGGTGFYGAIAKGVLLTGNGTNLTKKTIGSDGQVLTADSTDGTGMSWQSPVLPTGVPLPFMGSSAPSGFLLCDGSAVSRTTYAALFAVIGITSGSGDGSTTFNVPDGRGRTFIGTGLGSKTATIASVSGNVMTVTGITNAANNEFQTGQVAVFTATVAGNLITATPYYVVRTGNLTFSLATNLANAQNGIVITLAGTERGTLKISFATRSVGDTGGEETHAMSQSELLAHSHVSNVITGGSSTGPPNATNNFGGGSTSSAGGNSAMNIMQPFFGGVWIIKT